MWRSTASKYWLMSRLFDLISGLVFIQKPLSAVSWYWGGMPKTTSPSVPAAPRVLTLSAYSPGGNVSSLIVTSGLFFSKTAIAASGLVPSVPVRECIRISALLAPVTAGAAAAGAWVGAAAAGAWVGAAAAGAWVGAAGLGAGVGGSAAHAATKGRVASAARPLRIARRDETRRETSTRSSFLPWRERILPRTTRSQGRSPTQAVEPRQVVAHQQPLPGGIEIQALERRNREVGVRGR